MTPCRACCLVVVLSLGTQALIAQQPALTVDKSVSFEAELSWSGGVPQYEVYRGFSADGLFAPANKLGETAAGPWSVTASGSTPDLVFYRVRATGRCDFTQTDATIVAGDPSGNYGDLPLLDVADSTAPGGARHSLMRFDLSEIPAGSTVTHAVLRLFPVGNLGPSFDLDLRPLTDPWNELQVSWNQRPGIGSSAGNPTLSGGEGWQEIDLLGLVQNWVNDPSGNYGMSLLPSGITGAREFYSSERPPADVGPRLCVEWSSPSDLALEAMATASTRTPQIGSRDGQVQFWSGDVPSSLPTTDPVVQALEHLHSYRDLYAFDDPQGELYLSRVVKEGDRTHVIFQQRIDNIPVWASEVAVHLHNGTVEATSSYLVEPPPALPAVTVGPDQADAIARAAIVGSSVTSLAQPVLMVFDLSSVTRQPSVPRLVWRVLAHSLVEGQSETWQAMVAVDDGQLLHLTGLNPSATAPDKDFDIMSADNTMPGGFCYNISVNSINWFDEDGTLNYAAADDQFGQGPPTYYHTHDTYDMYYNSFGRRSINGHDNQVEAMLHVGTNFQNAQWVPPCKQMRFGTGWSVSDVYAHEYTHGVINFTSDLVYLAQPGAINESLADIFGSFADFEFADGDWTMAEDVPLSQVNSCNGTDGTIRDLSDPPLCGDPDHVLSWISGDSLGLFVPPNPTCGPGGNDCGRVHTNSGISNKAAYLITDGGLHNGFVMAGIGRTKAKRLYYDLMVSRLRENSQFSDLRDAAVDLAQDYVRDGRYSFADSDACTVINAFFSVGLGNPDEDCDGDAEAPGSIQDPDGDFLDGTDDNCPYVKNVHQEDLDGDGTGDVCDEDVDGDLIDNRYDNCVDIPNNGQADNDNDGRGDACEDNDGDGWYDANDNCPSIWNWKQYDYDGDGVGDDCDTDDDDDGLVDSIDPCPYFASPTGDEDGDLVGDACDNCPTLPNNDQADTDFDDMGDVCDTDDDNDGYPDAIDNCPLVRNPDQIDSNGNGLGLECDLIEQGWFDGIQQLGTLLLVVDPLLDRPVTLPIYPCTSNCPDWIDPDTITTVLIDTTPAMIPRIVDNFGNVIEADVLNTGGSYQLSFPPSADSYYRSPATALVPSTSPWATEEIRVRSYRLELFQRPGSVPEPTQVAIEVITVP